MTDINISKLILDEMSKTRTEIRADIKDLHVKIDGNYGKLINKHHELDKKVLSNKIKTGTIMSLLSIFWAGLITYFTKKV